MVNALVVHCHPCPDSLTAAARDRVLEALRAGGHPVELIDLHADGFDPRLTAFEHGQHRASADTKPSLAIVAEQLRRCDLLVLVYPTWWGGQPAMLKGWFERVWVNDIASRVRTDGRPPTPLLTNIRRIVAVTTHGSSKWLNSLEGEPGKRFLERALRASVGTRCRVEWLALYGIDRSDESERRRFLDRVSRRFARIS
mgnify:CR=1 FL=1